MRLPLMLATLLALAGTAQAQPPQVVLPDHPYGEHARKARASADEPPPSNQPSPGAQLEGLSTRLRDLQAQLDAANARADAAERAAEHARKALAARNDAPAAGFTCAEDCQCPSGVCTCGECPKHHAPVPRPADKAPAQLPATKSPPAVGAGAAAPSAQPQMADISGKLWTHADPAYLRSSVAAENARITQADTNAMRGFIQARNPQIQFYAPQSSCANGQCGTVQVRRGLFGGFR